MTFEDGPERNRALGVYGAVRRLLVAGLALLAVAALLLTRIPNGGHYATSLPPAFLLAGLGGGMSAPAVQIAALSGVAPALTGVASGLLETMREVAGAITQDRGALGEQSAGVRGQLRADLHGELQVAPDGRAVP